jgi:opacity protein-like surface antigen
MTRRLILSGLCLLLSNNAFADWRNAEINVFGAGSFYIKNNYLVGFPQLSTPVPGHQRFDSAGRFGVRLGVYTHGRWGEEFYYSFENNTMTITGPPSPNTTDVRLRISQYGVNALYYLNDTETHVFQPFLSAGLGGSLYQIRQESLVELRSPSTNLHDMNNSNELAFNWGIGFKTHSNGWLGFRIDVRDFIGRAPSFGLARQSIDPRAVVLPASGALNNAEASAGLSFYFGR